MKTKFTLAFQIITEESAANGDYSSCGLITRPGNSPNRSLFGLREAIAIFRNFYDGSGPVEADCSPISKETPPRWFNTCNQGFNADGENVNVSLHIPKEVSPSSAMRLARYLRCHGLTRP